MSRRSKDVRFVLKSWLISRGFDGLVNDDRNCCCHVSSLLSCCDPSDLCRAAHHIPYDDGCELAPGAAYGETRVEEDGT